MAMLITCPDCDTDYDIDRRSLGAHGRPVRCARCGQNWFAAPAPAASALDDFGWKRSESLNADESAILERAAASPPTPDWLEGRGAAADQRESDVTAAAMAAASLDDRYGTATAGPNATAAVDLDFEPAPPLVPLAGGTAEAEPDSPRESAAAPETIEANATGGSHDSERRAAAHKPRRAGWRPGRGLLLALFAAILTGLVAGRTQMVRIAPQTAGLYAAIGLPVNLRGLRFEDVATSTEIEAPAGQPGVPVLLTQGRIVNVTSHEIAVPRLRFAVRDAAGVETYAWTAQPDAPVLAAGANLAFRTRLASPPADAHTVSVRFFNRLDRGGD